MSETNTDSFFVTGKSLKTDINDLSMRLFMNKANYNKYIEKTDPKEHEHREEYLGKLSRLRARIMDITLQKIQLPDKQHTTDLDSAFEHYMRACIKHFDMQEIENKNIFNHENDVDNEDDNTLFTNTGEILGLEKFYKENDHDNYDNDDDDDDCVYDLHLPPMINNYNGPLLQSFWGKPILKKTLNRNPKKYFEKKEEK